MDVLPPPPQEWCDINWFGVVSIFSTAQQGCYPNPYYQRNINNPLGLFLPSDGVSLAGSPDNNTFIPMSGVAPPTYINPAPSLSGPDTGGSPWAGNPKLDSSTPDVNPDCSIRIPGSTKTIGDIAKQYDITNVPDSLVAAIQEQESGRNPNIGCNSSGACGIGQIKVSVWGPRYGLSRADILNPDINTSVTLRILSDAIRKYGDIPTAIHSYYGFGTPSIGPSGSTYTSQVLAKWKKYQCESTDIPNTANTGLGNGAYCPITPKGIT